MEISSYRNSILFTLLLLLGSGICNNFQNLTEDEGLPAGYFLKYVLANSLKHEDPCSWEDEKFRQVAYLQALPFPRGSKPAMHISNNFIRGTVERGRKYCKAMSFLVCDKATEKCECGDFAMQAQLGDKYKASNYILEDDAVRGKMVCRWSESAPCWPPQPPPRGVVLTSLREVITCSNGLQCISRHDATFCTNETISAYINAAVEEKKSYGELVDGMRTGKMCACAKIDEKFEDSM